MPPQEDERRFCETSRGRARAAGAAYAMVTTHAEALAALLAVCLFTVVVVVVAIGIGALALAPATRAHDSRRCDEQSAPISVYFVKHEQRRWTMDELCCIEIAARKHSQLDIAMVNVKGSSGAVAEEPLGKEITSTANKADVRSRLLEMANVRSVELDVAKLFERSVLSRRLSGNSTSEQIELAAKFQVIWDSSGISLEPRDVVQLESALHFLDDQAEATATIQLDEDLQAASVPCQSFIGSVIAEMARDFADRRTLVGRALANFCPSSSRCAGVRIAAARATEAADRAQCPIVDSCSADGD
ncbi:uncharacterized protein LOC131667249 [Phymastichus coffea]|uniref:uncharacterized protein LOC131667249 n=1 Tax=Phymastichus coffea TaxID=108790 RepID=UPI00273ADDD0|nr:uncharacterized protein LOC131667249 [Phymastichus coffea]